MGWVDYRRLRENLASWDARLRADPGSGHPHARVSSRHVENLHAESSWQEYGKQFHIACDEARERGGDDQEPSPLRYFLAGIAFCQQVFYAKGAALVGCSMRDVQIEVESYFDMRGEFTVPRDTTADAGVQWIVLTGRVTSDDSADLVLAAVDEANARCPVVNTLNKGVPVYERIWHNDRLVRDTVPSSLAEVPTSQIP